MALGWQQRTLDIVKNLASRRRAMRCSESLDSTHAIAPRQRQHGPPHVVSGRFDLGAPLTKLRLIVADDSQRFLQKIVSVLSVEFEVVATAADGKTALDLVRQYEPDLVVSDLDMPVLNGIQVTRELAKNPSSPPVVICSAETDPEIVEAAREAGALDYVFKSRIETELILAVKSAVQSVLV